MNASTASTPARTALPPPLHLGEGTYLDTVTAAELLACTTRTVTNLITRGHLPAVRPGPGKTPYRIPADALLAFVERYGHHQPELVADTPDAARLPEFTTRPTVLEVSRSPDGLLRVRPHRPPDPDQQDG
ncbi:helix-turn-helix domain-containing protein [Deinococcus ficus]|uniref:helix-turn-helix domain-containing protein n=1 Tax=Deinococcus ficus TaxID=317577 RepID=UPI00174EA7F8|nr:helix-turn-helix domain-containing protein [Deinococcus ficus]GHF91529.1 hypothetical protein GCM10017782_30460 [Deinococcus ficus]